MYKNPSVDALQRSTFMSDITDLLPEKEAKRRKKYDKDFKVFRRDVRHLFQKMVALYHTGSVEDDERLVCSWPSPEVGPIITMKYFQNGQLVSTLEGKTEQCYEDIGYMVLTIKYFNSWDYLRAGTYRIPQNKMFFHEISHFLFGNFAPCEYHFYDDELYLVDSPPPLDRLLQIGCSMLWARFGQNERYEWFSDKPFGNDVKRAGFVSRETEARFEGIEIRRHRHFIEIEVYRTDEAVFVHKNCVSLSSFKNDILVCMREMTLPPA